QEALFSPGSYYWTFSLPMLILSYPDQWRGFHDTAFFQNSALALYKLTKAVIFKLNWPSYQEMSVCPFSAPRLFAQEYSEPAISKSSSEEVSI
ncbi:MAG: hypothetical protein ACE5I1_19230, partial [bacterium]